MDYAFGLSVLRHDPISMLVRDQAAARWFKTTRRTADTISMLVQDQAAARWVQTTVLSMQKSKSDNEDNEFHRHAGSRPGCREMDSDPQPPHA